MIQQLQKWNFHRSWQVRSRTTLAQARWQTKHDCFVTGSTFTDQVSSGSTWTGGFSHTVYVIMMHVWIKTFFKPWSDLMWLVLKVVLLSCFFSVCEHIWSIEDWIHSKSRNRFDLELVESLVLTPIWSWNNVWNSTRPSAPVRHWDDGWRVFVRRRASEDGTPHGVFESESESESKKNFD